MVWIIRERMEVSYVQTIIIDIMKGIMDISVEIANMQLRNVIIQVWRIPEKIVLVMKDFI